MKANILISALGVLVLSLHGFNAFSCETYTVTRFDADVVAARVENGQCIVSARVNYIKRPKTCTVNLQPRMLIEILAPRQLITGSCPVNGGLFVEGSLRYLNGNLFLLTSGELW